MGEKVVIFYLPKFPRRANAFCTPNCNCKANVKILVPVYFLPSALLLIQDRSCLWSLEASYLGQPLPDRNILQLSEFYRTKGKAYKRVSKNPNENIVNKQTYKSNTNKYKNEKSARFKSNRQKFTSTNDQLKTEKKLKEIVLFPSISKMS